MESRTAEQIREHYEIEKDIARRLRDSTVADRRKLYNAAYDELFLRVPHHPLLNNDTFAENERRVAKEISNMDRFLGPQTTYLEIGPGDCAIAFEAATRVKKAYAVDVSEVVTARAKKPDNFELILSDGIEVPVPAGSIDFAYSNQLMEHLHANDSEAQLRNIFVALKPNGRYLCVTPNRLTGPHDISRDFDDEATCLHLREFTVTELDRIFREVGFARTFVYLKYGSITMSLPVLPFRLAESVLGILPHRLRKMLTFNKVVRFLLGVKLVGEK